jgi:TetR/AcrR family transcriptional repressor of bet genes
MARQSTEERRHQIAQAMKDVMAERGYEGASIVEVARRAGLNPGLVHYHFTDKQEVLLALLALLRREACQRVAAALEARSPGAPEERLERLIDAYLGLDGSQDPAAVACWVALSAEAVRQPAVRRPFAEAIEEQVRTIEEVVAEALPPSSHREASRIAAAIFAAVQGYFVLAATCPGVVPPRSAAGSTRDMARALLAGGRNGRKP